MGSVDERREHAPSLRGRGAGRREELGGSGVEAMSEALELNGVTVVQRGNDIEVTGYPRKGSLADEG